LQHFHDFFSPSFSVKKGTEGAVERGEYWKLQSEPTQMSIGFIWQFDMRVGLH